MELMISNLCISFPSPVAGESSFTLNIPRLSLQAGEVTFLMGHNGSGKSLMLRLLAGELLPTSGEVRIDQGGQSWIAPERSLGMVRQQAEKSLAMELTVSENLYLRLNNPTLLGQMFPARALASTVSRLLKSQPLLRGKLGHLCRNLSIGQRQTLAFISVAARDYPILLLDEFLASTDRTISVLLRSLARDYASRIPACVLIVSHDIRLALEEADRVLALRSGRLVADLRPDDKGTWSEATLVDLLAYQADP